MEIANNILKERLKNVYFVCGTACGGKSTITRRLAQKHNLTLYNMDDAYDRHRDLANETFQPAMTQRFQSWEQYFCRPPQTYASWLKKSMEEQLQMVVLDLVELSKTKKVVADLHLPPALANQLASWDRLIFLIAHPQLIANDYYHRPDHAGLHRCIMALSNPQQAMDNCSRALELVNGPVYDAVKAGDLFWLERVADSTVEGMLRQVEAHFGLGQ